MGDRCDIILKIIEHVFCFQVKQKKTMHSPKVNALVKIILVCLISTLLNLSCCLPIPLSPKDDYRENITIEEAQTLVPFSICFPSYLPSGINPTPEIIYDSEWESPEETYIRLCYKEIYKDLLVFELSQRFSPNEVSLKTEYPESSFKRIKYIFFYWLSPGNTSEIESMVKMVKLEHEVFQSDQTVWWLYEIVQTDDLMAP
jgi:hypothetical protein